jgi:hypothetical protein
MNSRRNFLKIGAAGAATSLLPGCGSIDRGTSVPTTQTFKASVLGLPNERFYPTVGVEALEDEFEAAARRQVARRKLRTTAELDLKFLAVSGGGEDGAFGAGVLCGWTERGDRPTFDLVTGVSTGALTAPMAFLGSAYNPQLRHVYTEITPERVLISRGVSAALFNDALADNAPLFKTISDVLDDKMLADIAAGYSDGRLLLIGTTNLDAQVPVIWNIGAIASSGHPKALDTVRRILLASAAIPGAFPPSMFDVMLDGKPYQEMHVDGGAFVQSFLYPGALSEERRGRIAKRQKVSKIEAYVIRNGRLDPHWAEVRRQMLGIAGRAISTMITASGYNDLVRIYFTSKRDGVGFHLAYIGSDFDRELPSPFNPAYMRALFEYGYDKAKVGYPWASKPPYVG